MLLAKVASPIVPDTLNKKLSKAPSPEVRWSKGRTYAQQGQRSPDQKAGNGHRLTELRTRAGRYRLP
ncbi:MAG: hypothetical protein ABGZ19_05425, partial [Verrucomicrobiales bacterium]